MNEARMDPGTWNARRHVHYDVVPDLELLDGGRQTVGYRVRLWAVHERGARPLPGCPKCLDLVAALRALAHELVPSEAVGTRVTIEPFRPALYDSSIVPETDEVFVSIRIAPDDPLGRPVGPRQERCLKAVRDRAKRLGIPER